MLFKGIAISIVFLFGIVVDANTDKKGGDAQMTITTQYVAQPKALPLVMDWEALYDIALMTEFYGLHTPSDEWMLRVAQCETGIDPAHIGNTQQGHTYRGAFGFYTQEGGRGGTWDQWGGWEFAPYANEATLREQIVIFLRVHLTGFYDYRLDKQKWWEPAGYSVNNCSRFAGERDSVKR